jgi:hypothetical protein
MQVGAIERGVRRMPDAALCDLSETRLAAGAAWAA